VRYVSWSPHGTGISWSPHGTGMLVGPHTLPVYQLVPTRYRYISWSPHGTGISAGPHTVPVSLTKHLLFTVLPKTF
jgi:hypothetical protein